MGMGMILCKCEATSTNLKMDCFNSKLYSKYQKLKKRKGYVEDEQKDKLDAEIRSYQLAAEDLIGNLKNENDRLRVEISSTQEKYDECRELLLEESRKTRELSNKIEKLQNLLSQKNDNQEIAHLVTPCTSPGVGTRSKSKSSLKRKSLKSHDNDSEVQHNEVGIVPYVTYQEEQIVPDCCRKNMIHKAKASCRDQTNCVFQTLTEFLVGMKFSIDGIEGLGLSVSHQRSGYTFSLTWVEHEDDGEGEFLYHASSLGTLERVALDWMKEDIAFSMTMWPVFFQRISRVSGGR